MGVRVRRASPSFGPALSRAASALRRWWPETALGVGVVVAILGPVLRRGFVLRYDLVFVPDPPFGAVVWGSGSELPRAVPSELLAVGLSQIVPADVAQKVLLAGCLVLAAVGAARLAPVGHPLARAAAGLAVSGTPFLEMERMGILPAQHGRGQGLDSPGAAWKDCGIDWNGVPSNGTGAFNPGET